MANITLTWKTRISDAIDLAWELRDKRVDGYPTMSNPLPTVAICILYIYLVKIWGPNFMKDRKAIDCTRFLLWYNTFQVLLSTYIFAQGLRAGWWPGGYSIFCEPVNPHDSLMVHCVWIYYLSKYTELIDTFCFVARKKFSQVSLLHVYHHAIMPINLWFGCRYLPGGHGTFFGLVNAFVHIVMYSYYLLAGLGPKFQKYIWWKVYVTKLQLTQFILVLLHTLQLFYNNDCGYPILFAYIIVGQALIFLAFFSEFYIRAYIFPKKKLQVGEGSPMITGNENSTTKTITFDCQNNNNSSSNNNNISGNLKAKIS